MKTSIEEQIVYLTKGAVDVVFPVLHGVAMIVEHAIDRRSNTVPVGRQLDVPRFEKRQDGLLEAIQAV